MTCPSDQDLAHIAECAVCRARTEKLAGAAAAIAEAYATPPDPGFVAGVMSELDPPRRRSSVARMALAASLLVMAAISLVTLNVTGVRTPDITARGSRNVEHTPDRALGFELRRNGARLSEGDTIARGDGLTFRFFNRSNEDVELMLFAIDAANEIHWLVPSWTEASAPPPRSYTLRADRPIDDPPEGVIPETPALGALKVIALFDDRPMSAAKIEALKERAYPTASMQTLTLEVTP